ncbi:hypothetical protein TWF281_007141 [Arthrobotrys megalospora]
MSSPHPYTTTHTPGTFLLTDSNYLEWSILMERCIERFDWKQLLYKPHNAAVYTDRVLAARAMYKRNQCSTFILENVDTKYWFLFNPRERDPCVLWKEIKDVWLPSDDDTAGNYEDRIKNLIKGSGSMMDYVARARLYWENYKEAGGTQVGEKEMVEYVLAGIREEGYKEVVGRLQDGGSEVDLDYVLKMLVKTESALRIKYVRKLDALQSKGRR